MNLVVGARILLGSSLAWGAGCAAGFQASSAPVAASETDPEAPSDVTDSVSAAIGDFTFPRPAPKGDATDLSLRGDFALRQHRLEDAAQFFDAAVRAAPSKDAWRYERALADALLGLHQNAGAERLYASLAVGESHPRSSTLHGNLAAARFRMGDAAGARAAAEEALEINSANYEALKTLGLVDILDGKREIGWKRLETAIEKSPRMPEAQVALAEAEAEAGNAAAAAARYRLLLEWLPGAAETDYHRRWRDLFYPGQVDTEKELQARLSRLEAAAKSPEAGAASGNAPPQGRAEGS